MPYPFNQQVIEKLSAGNLTISFNELSIRNYELTGYVQNPFAYLSKPLAIDIDSKNKAVGHGLHEESLFDLISSVISKEGLVDSAKLIEKIPCTPIVAAIANGDSWFAKTVPIKYPFTRYNLLIQPNGTYSMLKASENSECSLTTIVDDSTLSKIENGGLVDNTLMDSLRKNSHLLVQIDAVSYNNVHTILAVHSFLISSIALEVTKSDYSDVYNNLAAFMTKAVLECNKTVNPLTSDKTTSSDNPYSFTNTNQMKRDSNYVNDDFDSGPSAKRKQ
jgi:hypothetical protein